MALVQIDIPKPSDRNPSRFDTIFALGFRPLYLLSAIWAAVAVVLWIFTPQLLTGTLNGVWWHAHEMLWGFIATVAVGFLLTASATWTGRNPLKSWGLACLCAIWLIARIAYLLPAATAFVVGAIADVVFFVYGAIALARVLYKVKSKQNYPLVVALLGLAASNAVYLYMVAMGQVVYLRTGFHIGMLVMTFIALLIGRRVIPFFAQRGANLDIPRSEKSGKYQLWLSALAVVSLVAGVHVLTSVLLFVLAGITLYQLYSWQPLGVRKVPLLWVLYISYGLLGLGLLAAAVYFLPLSHGVLPPATFVHLIGMGGFSVMIIGMMTRTALGHTGRPLRASKLMVMAYVFVVLATVLRLLAIFVPMILSAINSSDLAIGNNVVSSSINAAGVITGLWHASACFWVIAFLAYVYQYAPYLTSPRADGRPG
ncbi:NnrS family protein [Pelistega europaea]|uniref:NnrS family protein n=1 Tax=Pelistega europaea TaxID=106147 RepID=A0A7Y4LD62_9BURK|nr:NnrS family protein [Pelistega europaea]NOL50256.1 NnrS family protein [Pelistega europaea]